MQKKKKINGSPRVEACANIDSHGTANSSSPSRAISAATGDHPPASAGHNRRDPPGVAGNRRGQEGPAMTEPRTPAGSGPVEKEIRRAAELIADGVIEVRVLTDGATHSGYFDDYKRLTRAVEALDADPSVTGIYVTLNTVNPALLARRANRIKMRLSHKDATTADADIIRRRWLPIDIDPVRPSGVSSTDAEHEAALDAATRIAEYLAELGFGEPIRADSGNGAHLLYRIDLANDEAAKELIKGTLTTLDILFSNDLVTVDTTNYNAARIWKLYGTVSRKGDSTPKRPHRRAGILSLPGEMTTVPTEKLQHLAGLLPREEPARPEGDQKIDLGRWLAEHGIAVRNTKPWNGGTLYALAECPFSGAHRDGAFAIQFANGAIHAGCHHTSCGGGAQRWSELRGMHEARKAPAKKPRAKTRTEDPAPPDEYRRRALEILRTGDALAFILDTFNKTHVGDRTVAECLAYSVASRSVENTNGLHVSISGNSGKGKTHACTTMLNLIPENSRLKGTVSDRALYYDDDLRAGTVFLFDDVSLSDDLQEVLKSATTNFREPIEHRTVTAERKLRVCTIPPRCIWWLAKVEDPGDDQVMNRMLTVWIDDSIEQDRRVFEHIRNHESKREQGPTPDDIQVCRAIWEVVGEEVCAVTIPFARQIGSSTTQNRRNPGMLFDLIKCHARLFSFQRDRDEDGAVIARKEDFYAAAKLYSTLSGVAGGQETKLTKNEAAALATIEKMGIEVFTVRQLQNALGLSYHQTYRLLHGYTNNRATYTGILDKCPAVSYIDATVSGDMNGYAVRRREHYFSFDLEAYRAWSAQTTVWLEDDPGGPDDTSGGSGGPDVCTSTPGLHTDPACGANEKSPQDADSSSIREICTEISTDKDGSLHHLPGTESPVSGSGSPSPGAREISSCVNIPEICKDTDPIANLPPSRGFSECKIECEDVQTSVNVQTTPRINPRDYIALPVAKDEPCHICGRRPTSSILRGSGGKYLCYNCLQKAKQPAKVQPLPGVLDHRTFSRVRVDIGRCDICNAKRAVYWSREAQAKICDECYARLVREWNAKAGVR